MNTYMKPQPRPYQLLRDMLRTHWDVSSLKLPTIIEIPSPEFERADLINEGPYILITVLEMQKEPIHIGFKNIDITVPVTIDVSLTDQNWNRTSNRRGQDLLYDYMYEIERILQENQHDPNVYLLDGFDNYEDNDSLKKVWSNNVVRVFSSQFSSQFGEGSSFRASLSNDGYSEKAICITGSIERSIPEIEETRNNKIPLIPTLSNRLDTLFMYIKKEGNSSLESIEITQNGKKITLNDMPNITDNWAKYRFDLTQNIINIMPNDDDNIIKINVSDGDDSNKIFIDHIQLSTREYQFFLWGGWNVDVEGVYGINLGTLNGSFRSVGDGISLLGGYSRYN